MNSITLSGRLTKEPEVKNTQSGVIVAHFPIAVDRPGTSRENRITDFFDCVVWGGKDGPGRAGVIEKWFHKGDGIVLRGVMQQRKWQDKDGNNRTSYEVKVDDFEFPMGKKGDGAPAPQNNAPIPQEMTAVSDDSLPF